MNPLERRMMALNDLLRLERPTSKAKLYTEWQALPEVHLENEDTKTYYENLILK